MAKFKGMIFAREFRESLANGAARRYRMPQELVRMLGQGKALTFHGRVYTRTPTGQVSFYGYHGCHGNDLPVDAGFPLTFSGTSGPITTEGDAEFLSYLAADLGELRKLFDGFVTGWRPTISVFESGVNVACTNPQNKHKGVAPDVVPGVDGGCEADVPTTETTPSFRPRVFDPATGADLGTMGARDFAGASAWIRLAVAYAAGADAFGWHTHMSDPNTAFAGMGLREDTEDDKNDYTKAQPRPSWHAVQRFVELLGSAADARILFPSIGESHEKHADLIKSSSPDLMAPWAIEFSFLHSPLGIYDQWAYLLFVDPYATVDKATTGVKLADPLFYTFTLKDRTGSATGITQVNLPPTSFNPSTSPKTLPPSTYAAGATVSVLPTSGNTYVFSDVQPGQYPILLFSPRQLDVDAEPTQKT